MRRRPSPPLPGPVSTPRRCIIRTTISHSARRRVCCSTLEPAPVAMPLMSPAPGHLANGRRFLKSRTSPAHAGQRHQDAATGSAVAVECRGLGAIRDAGFTVHHGIGHHLGLIATRPPGNSQAKNMVLTVEPGIYLPDEGIGVRIEDDIIRCRWA